MTLDIRIKLLIAIILMTQSVMRCEYW